MKKFKLVLLAVASLLVLSLTSCSKTGGGYDDYIPASLYGTWSNCTLINKTGSELEFRKDRTGYIQAWLDGKIVDGWDFTYGYDAEEQKLRLKVAGSYMYYNVTSCNGISLNFYYIDSDGALINVEMYKVSDKLQ